MAKNFNSFSDGPRNTEDRPRDDRNYGDNIPYEGQPNSEREGRPEDESNNYIEKSQNRILDAMTSEGSDLLNNLKENYGQTFEDMKEAATDKLRGIGKAVAKFSKKAGLAALGAGVMGAREGRNLARKAQENINARAEARQQKREQKAHQKELDAAHAEALNEDTEREAEREQVAYDSGQFNARRAFADAETARTSEFNTAEEREQATERAAELYRYSPEEEGSYSDGWESIKQALLDKAHEEALVMNEQFDEQKEAERFAELAREYAEYKAYRAQQRVEIRQKAYDATVGRANQWYTSAKKQGRKNGNSIASFAKRTVAASQAARFAAQESWQNSNE